MSTATETAIEADPKLPIIRITREFAATPGQLFRAHTDPALFAQWVGPDAASTPDRALGRPHRRQLALRHQARRPRSTRSAAASTRCARTASCRPSPIEGEPDGVALETRWFEASAAPVPGCASQSLVDSFAGRDA